MSLAGVRLLARWRPAWRWQEPGLQRLHGTGEGVRRVVCGLLFGCWRTGS